MNANMYNGSQDGNQNIYYGQGNNQVQGGYNPPQQSNEMRQFNQMNNNQNTAYNDNTNIYLNNNNNPYYNTSTNNNNQFQYPTTGLSPNDCEENQNDGGFVLPENIKLCMILTMICCLFCFFVVLLF